MLPTKLAFLDIETTGANLTSDRIIDIGILRVENNKLVNSYSTLIDPGDDVPPEITRLTGITTDQTRRAPTFSQVRDDILELVKDCVVVAHNAQFDYSFLKAEFKRTGRRFANRRLCTVKLSRALFPRFKRHNLDTIIERHGIVCEDRHRGLGDAKVLWDFYQRVLNELKEEKILEAVTSLLRRPSLPLNIDKKIVADLPKTPGVYVFYGAAGPNGSDGAPLYVGKSKNIKKRVMQHFTNSSLSSTEMKIAHLVKSIEAIKTAGELGALIRESDMVKKLQPLYNRVLRKTRKLVVLKRVKKDGDYTTVTLEDSDQISPEDLPNLLLIFKSQKQAKDYLVDCAKNHALCEKLLGLEKTKRQCFGNSLGRCRGACIGEEPTHLYNVRFEEAFGEKAIKPWPYSGPVVIEEWDEEKEAAERILVDKWCLLGPADDAYSQNSLKDIVFDFDIYKILVRYFRNKENQSKIHQAPAVDTGIDTASSYL